MIDKLTLSEIENIQCFHIAEKVIYPIPRMDLILSKITYFSFYVDIDLHIPIHQMTLLKSLKIDINNNSEMLFFNEYMKEILSRLNELKYFQKLIIECDGLELFKILKLLQYYQWKDIQIIIKCFHLQQSHLLYIKNELNQIEKSTQTEQLQITDEIQQTKETISTKKRNKHEKTKEKKHEKESHKHQELQINMNQLFNKIHLCSYTNEMDCFYSDFIIHHPKIINYDIIILYDNQNELSIPIQLINDHNIHLLMNKYYLYRLNIFGYTNEEFILKELQLSNEMYLNEIQFHNVYCHKKCMIHLPHSLKILQCHHCSHFSFTNLQTLQLNTMILIHCSSFHHLSFPQSLSRLEIKYSSIHSELNLETIQLQHLKLYHVQHMKRILIPKSLITLSLCWCDELITIKNVEISSLQTINLFHCSLLQPIQLPLSIHSIYVSFCPNCMILNRKELIHVVTQNI